MVFVSLSVDADGGGGVFWNLTRSFQVSSSVIGILEKILFAWDGLRESTHSFVVEHVSRRFKIACGSEAT